MQRARSLCKRTNLLDADESLELCGRRISELNLGDIIRKLRANGQSSRVMIEKIAMVSDQQFVCQYELRLRNVWLFDIVLIRQKNAFRIHEIDVFKWSERKNGCTKSAIGLGINEYVVGNRMLDKGTDWFDNVKKICSECDEHVRSVLENSHESFFGFGEFLRNVSERMSHRLLWKRPSKTKTRSLFVLRLKKH